jgi:catechol-2,3-dioxygenase
MAGLGLNEMKTVVDSELAVAHLVFKVADLKSSCQFYSKLGLPPFATDEKVAIIELRGGTHLLLLSVDEPAGEDIAESVTGQFHKRFSEQFDLMIEGKGMDELKKYRSELISRGIAAGEIPDESFFGHYLFCIKDPDGNGITIYTSHAI